MATHYAPFGDLLHTTRTGEVGATKFLGRPFFEWVSSSTELAQLQNRAMAEFTSAARAGVFDAFQFPGGGVVADIGGADGTFLAEILSQTPGCRGIVFDLPDVVSAAPDTLAAAGLSDRATVAAGDFFDHVPDADTYVLSSVLHDWSDADAIRILRNIARAAPEEARLLLVELVLRDDDIPHIAKLRRFHDACDGWRPGTDGVRVASATRRRRFHSRQRYPHGRPLLAPRREAQPNPLGAVNHV
jgi:hypothetical protein